ncbi:biofilm development regulator YmgB/AriR family protein [Pantoea sp. BAV 3049]|uniref:biofilm development regulator YmgB/AriR family protein n=1 Tax=Pantoea sp. BAV 3049 TaxID=2654188 RepID=UPI00131BAB7C|nr:biofilm development regulator YmgB/AriR family protein [Pantoea sp. BAV 3049]
MRQSAPGAGRAITDYFNSPAFHAPKESELLAAILTELMRSGRPTTSKVILASVISKLEGEVDEATLQGYRNLLTQLLDEKES